MLHDVARGTANLQLQSVTSADTRVYQCRVEVVGDEEGSASDTAKLIVLGKTRRHLLNPSERDIWVILCQINQISESSLAQMFDFVQLFFRSVTNIMMIKAKILNIMDEYLLNNPLL